MPAFYSGNKLFILMMVGIVVMVAVVVFSLAVSCFLTRVCLPSLEPDLRRDHVNIVCLTFVIVFITGKIVKLYTILSRLLS